MIMRSLLLLHALQMVSAMPSHMIPPGLQAQFAPGLEQVSTVEQNLPCTLIEAVIEYGGGVEAGSEWYCEVFGIDARNVGSPRDFARVKVEGMDKVFSAKSDIASGRTTMFARGARFRNGNLVIGNGNNNNAFEFGDNQAVGNTEIRHQRKLASTTGNLQVLVVRVSAADTAMTKAAAEISGDVFGTTGSGDSINLKSNAEGCSNGLVTINPGSGTGSSCVDDPDAVFAVNRNDPGITYNCGFFNDYMFSTPGDLCDTYGSDPQVDDPNESANTRCCICGGGDQVPFDNNVVNGVMELQVNSNAVGANRSAFETEVIGKLNQLFNVNDLSERFDNVMICVPWGTVGGTAESPNQNWLAYAYIGGTVSVYNGDANCANEDNQMHEIGHNWGLRHAFEGADSYGDQTGFMGGTFLAPDDQQTHNKMCYNGAHSWQLGWYIPYNAEINPLTTNFDGTLVGVDRVPSVNAGENVVLKLTNSEEDYYLIYNHAVGVNAGTSEAPNKVTVTTRPVGDTPSALVAILGPNEHVTFNNWDGTNDKVTVMAGDITTGATNGNARVEVWKGAFTDRPSGPAVPATPAPTPTPPPTSGPTSGPTPTPAPTSGPTPTPPPTSGPTSGPTPTPAPTSGPTPTPPPTSGPTSGPTPTPPPTSGPTSGPTDFPTPVPATPAPTPPPTKKKDNQNSPRGGGGGGGKGKNKLRRRVL